MSEWIEAELAELIYINPRVSLAKNTIAKKVPMEFIMPYTKKVSQYVNESYKGGVKFINGDTLMARITPSLENGKTSFVDFLEDNEIGFGSTEFIVLRAKENISDPNFVYYLAISPEIREVAIQSMTGSSGRQRVQDSVVKNFLVSFPTLQEQKAIAEVLSSLDDKIDLLHHQNQTLEHMAETLFRKWFIEDTNEKNWKESTFGELVTPKKGKNITKTEAIEGEYPVVAGGLEPSCYHNEANTLEPVITISASGANAGFVRLYHTRVWSSDSSYIDKSITPNLYFCYSFLKIKQSNLFDKQEGSAQPHIYPKHIMELESFQYPIELIEMFEKEVTPMFQKIKYNLKQITSLEQLRDTLLPKFMNGEVRVKTI